MSSGVSKTSGVLDGGGGSLGPLSAIASMSACSVAALSTVDRASSMRGAFNGSPGMSLKLNSFVGDRERARGRAGENAGCVKSMWGIDGAGAGKSGTERARSNECAVGGCETSIVDTGFWAFDCRTRLRVLCSGAGRDAASGWSAEPSSGSARFSSSLSLVGSSSRRGRLSSRPSSEAPAPALYSSVGGGDADRFPDFGADSDVPSSEGSPVCKSNPSTDLMVLVRLALFAVRNGDRESNVGSSGSAKRDRVRAGAVLLAMCWAQRVRACRRRRRRRV